MCVRVCVCVCVCVSVCMYVSLQVCVCEYLSVPAYTCVHMECGVTYINLYIPSYQGYILLALECSRYTCA